MRVKLEVGIAANRPGTIVRQEGVRIQFGRGDGCDVVLQDDAVSRDHAELIYLDGRWMVRDLGSVNGTFLNRKRIAIAEARAGDILRLGEGGPKIRLVELAGPADQSVDDLEATRYVRLRPREAPAPPEVEVNVPPPPPPMPPPPPPPPEPKPAPRPAPQPKPKARVPASWPPRPKPARRGGAWPWLAVVGAVFGALTAYGVWPDRFPYGAVAAPAFWGTTWLAQASEWAAPRAGWLLVVALTGYWAAVGHCLQSRTLRPLLIFFLAAHAFIYLRYEYYPL